MPLVFILSPQRKVDVEDVHVSVYWYVPITFKDNGSAAFKLVPMIAVGGWLPAAEKRDQNKVYAVSTGNNGFGALTIDRSIMLDFPHTIQLGCGGGAYDIVNRGSRWPACSNK